MAINGNLDNETDNQPEIPLTFRFAALDLGSNSFHLVIAGLNQDEVRIKDKISEKVQLGAGIGPDKRISVDAENRALECLKRYADRLEGIPKDSVRVVGTNALRKAKNSRAFLQKAEAILGYEIDIIRGREEARLIYLGVSHTLADDSGPRLVIDIGGGSTEFIIGSRFEAKLTESLQMGCVSFASAFFEKGITEEAFNKAIIAAKNELVEIKKDLLNEGWSACVGASGSIRAIINLLKYQGKVDDYIQLGHLYDLRQQLLSFDDRFDIKLDGLSELRAPVLPSGLAILIAVFESLKIKSMQYSTGALREGLLYDMLGRIEHEDVRDRTVQAMALRYHVNLRRADRVKSTALELFELLGVNSLSHQNLAPYLGWASYLYQIGLSVSHSNFHKHGAYLIRHSDLAGFTKKEQAFLAAIVGNHRQSFKELEDDSALYFMLNDYMVLSICLRLALLIQRGYSESDVEVFRFESDSKGYTLQLHTGWRETNALLVNDMEQEIAALDSVGVKLRVI